MQNIQHFYWKLRMLSVCNQQVVWLHVEWALLKDCGLFLCVRSLKLVFWVVHILLSSFFLPQPPSGPNLAAATTFMMSLNCTFEIELCRFGTVCFSNDFISCEALGVYWYEHFIRYRYPILILLLCAQPITIMIKHDAAWPTVSPAKTETQINCNKWKINIGR